MSLSVRLLFTVMLALPLGRSAVAATQVDYQTMLAWLQQYAAAPTDGLAAGIYGSDRLADLAPYLPPGYLEEFNFPELKLELTPTWHYRPHLVFAEATAKFADQAHIGPAGELEGYTVGRPFSTASIVAASPEQAGYMVAWDQVRRWQYYGYRNDAVLSYLTPSANGKASNLMPGMHGGGNVERSISMFYHRVYLSGLAMLPENAYRMDVDSSDQLLFKEYIEMLAPFDIAGLKLVVERPLDQAQGDQVNSYLPSERRVRRLSAKERADSWLGTNWTLDDFEGYSGLVLDNTWKYIGRKVVLQVPSSEHEVAQLHGPMSTIPLDRWQLRPCFVVEAIPKWKGHPYGRRVLFVDEETFSVAVTLIFDRKDVLTKVMTTVYQYSEGLTDPEPALTIPRWRSSIVINLRDRTANVAQGTKATEFVKVTPSYVRQLFSVSNLTGGR